MTDVTERSLGELRELYTRKIRDWSERQLEHEKKIEECRREIASCEAKLRHVDALIDGTEEPAPVAARRVVPRRQSPVKLATKLALGNRPGEWLNTNQLLAAIKEDVGKRVSRQSVNVNLGLLEQEGLVRKRPASRESGARFVYSLRKGGDG